MPLKKSTPSNNYSKLTNDSEVASSSNLNQTTKNEEELNIILKNFNLSEEQQTAFATHVSTQSNMAKIKKNKELTKYFEKKAKYVTEFVKILHEKAHISFKLKKDPKNKELAGRYNFINHFSKELVKKSAEIKKNITKTGFIDNGPYLTEKGLIFPETNESEC